MRLLRPADVILNGDILDCYTISDFRRTLSGPKHLKDEWAIADDEIIRPLVRAIPKGANVVWVEGNHEDRFTNRLFDQLRKAELESVYGLLPSIPDFFRLKERGIKYIGSKAGNGIYKFTKYLTIMHGSRTGTNPAKSQLDDWGGSLIMGHVHKAFTWSQKKGDGTELVSLASGCLCLEPSWLDVDKWTRGFIVGWTDERGHFAAEHEKILIESEGVRELVSPSLGIFRATKLRLKNGSDKWVVKHEPWNLAWSGK